MGVSYIILKWANERSFQLKKILIGFFFVSNYAYLNKSAEKKFTERNGRNVNCHAAAV